MATGTTPHSRRHAGKRTITAPVLASIVAAGWMLLVLLYFLWEAFSYGGLYALLCEWQFDVFGHYFPTFTLLSLVTLFATPAILWLRWRQRRRRVHAEAAGTFDRRDALDLGITLRKVLFSIGGSLAAAAVLVLVATVFLPRMAPTQRIVNVGEPAAQPVERGPAVLQGKILYTRASSFSQDLAFTARSVRFAPIVGSDPADTVIRYFVELVPGEEEANLSEAPFVNRRGVLIRNGLPGSVLRLYRYAGFEVASPAYVLFTNDLTIRSPFYLAAIQLAIAAVVALLAGLLQHRHVVNLSRRRETPPAA